MMTTDVELLVTDWFRRVRESQQTHYACATWFTRLNYLLGIPTVILSAVVGTAVFAALETSGSGNSRIVVGMLSILAAVLASLQTFLGFGSRADRHRIAGAEYGAVRRDLEHLKTFPPADDELLRAATLEIKNRMDEAAKTSPEVPARIKARIDKKLKSREHRRVFHLVPQDKGVTE